MGNIQRTSNGAYVLPGILSAFLPGLGQLIKKQTGKALFFFAIWLGWGLITLAFNWLPLGGLATWLAGAFLWLVNVLDALFNGETR